jgi:hypothetical protein
MLSLPAGIAWKSRSSSSGYRDQRVVARVVYYLDIRRPRDLSSKKGPCKALESDAPLLGSQSSTGEINTPDARYYPERHLPGERCPVYLGTFAEDPYEKNHGPLDCSTCGTSHIRPATKHIFAGRLGSPTITYRCPDAHSAGVTTPRGRRPIANSLPII